MANEFCGYALCKALGLDCAQAEIISRQDAELPEQVPFDQILAVKRFDRKDGQRVHMEEFAQALHYATGKKYGKGMDDYARMLARGDLEALIARARLLRPSAVLKQCRDSVKQAQARWPSSCRSSLPRTCARASTTASMAALR